MSAAGAARHRRPRRPAAAVMAAAVVTGLAIHIFASASPAAAATSLRVDAGVAGGFFRPRAAVPVRVRVTADRLVRGQLEIDLGIGQPRASLPVEIPGGSRKQFLVVLDAPTEAVAEAQARLVDGGDTLASGRDRLQFVEDQELVGLLPGIRAGGPAPVSAPLAVDAGVARFHALTEAELSRAPSTFEAFSTIAAAPGDVEGLSPRSRRGLIRWLGAGGRLLLDVAPGDRVAGLPDDWQAGPAGRAVAGAGQVRHTDGAMAAGRWDRLVEPGLPAAEEVSSDDARSLLDVLAEEAGLTIPKLGWLLAFLCAYVLVAGPLIRVVLRRPGQAELAWVAIPLVAVLFAAGSYVAGRGLRPSARTAQGSLIQSTGAGAATAYTTIGVVSRSGGSPVVAFPQGWDIENLSERDPGRRSTAVALGGDGPRVELPLNAGQFDVVAAKGEVDIGRGLRVTASSDQPGVASGTVRNDTRLPLRNVIVFAGDSAVIVGALRPGEEDTWRVESSERHDRLGRFFGGSLEADMFWQAANIPGMPHEHGNVESLPWQVRVQAADPNFRGPGRAVATGWTKQFAAPVRVRGSARPGKGWTMITGEAPITRAGPATTELAVRREWVRGRPRPEGIWDRPFDDRGESMVVRFTLPPGHDVPADRLLLSHPLSGEATEIWTGTSWQRLQAPRAADLRPPDLSDEPAPPPVGAVPDGEGGVRIIPAPPEFREPQIQQRCERTPDGGMRCTGVAVPPFFGEQPGGRAGLPEVKLPPGTVHGGSVYLRFAGGMGVAYRLLSLREATA